MEVISLIFSTVGLCFCAFLLLVQLGMIRLIKQKDFKKNFRDTPDDMLNKAQVQPQERRSTFRA